jgi:hypothetical protein
MLKSLLRDKLLLGLLLTTVLIKILSLNESWVEHYYTYGFYPAVSRFLRILFGWLPFSFGDLVYLGAVFYILLKGLKFLRILQRRQVKEYLRWVLLKKFLRLLLWIYLVFNIFWGLNYNRLGMAYQLNLNVQPYTVPDLDSLTFVLQKRLNFFAGSVDSLERNRLDHNRVLFNEAIAAYKKVASSMPFLTYDYPSIKPSLYFIFVNFFFFYVY